MTNETQNNHFQNYTYLRGFHRIMFREINLKLVCLISIQSPWSSINFNYPPLSTKKKNTIPPEIKNNPKSIHQNQRRKLYSKNPKKKGPLEIIGDFMLKSGRRIDLPFDKLLLQTIGRYFT